MSFVFASSHLPELEHPADEEEEDEVQPMPRSGMVRAFSHLPQRVQGAPAAPRPSAPLPAFRPAWASAPEAPSGHAPADGHDPEPDDDADDGHGSSTSTSTGAHEPDDGRPWYQPRITHADLHPEGGEHDDPAPGSSGRPPKKWEPEHDPDPGFDGTPPKAWGKPTRDAGFEATAPQEWGPRTRDPGFDASPQDVHNGNPAPTDEAPAQRRAPFPQSRLFEKRPTPGSQAPATGRPVLNDLLYRTQSGPAEVHDLVYRTHGTASKNFAQAPDLRMVQVAAKNKPPVQAPEGEDEPTHDRDFTAEQQKKFIEAMKNKALELYHHHENRVGEKTPAAATAKRDGKIVAYCNQYPSECVAAGYEALGMPKTAQMIRDKTTKKDQAVQHLAKMLHERGWKSIFYNNDRTSPGSKGEHASDTGNVEKKGLYWGPE